MDTHKLGLWAGGCPDFLKEHEYYDWGSSEYKAMKERLATESEFIQAEYADLIETAIYTAIGVYDNWWIKCTEK